MRIGFNKKRKKIIIRILLGLCITTTGILYSIYYWEEPLRPRLQYRVSAEVIKYADGFRQCVKEYENREPPNRLMDI